MLDFLLAPFEYQFMLKALWVCTLVGIACALLSSFLVLNHWSLVGDALSHAVVPGVVLAYWLSLPFVLGAFFSGLLAAFVMILITKLTRYKQDVVIGFVFSGFFALGLLMISFHPVEISVQTIIMGTVYSINTNEFIQIISVFIALLVIMFFLTPSLVLIIFDRRYAFSIGINEWPIKIIFFAILSAVIVISLQAVGAILVIALLIIPGSTAYLITDRFGRLMFYSTLIGGSTAFLGAYLSYHFNTAAGPLIVLCQGIVIFIALIFSNKRGFYPLFLRRYHFRKQQQ